MIDQLRMCGMLLFFFSMPEIKLRKRRVPTFGGTKFVSWILVQRTPLFWHSWQPSLQSSFSLTPEVTPQKGVFTGISSFFKSENYLYSQKCWLTSTKWYLQFSSVWVLHNDNKKFIQYLIITAESTNILRIVVHIQAKYSLFSLQAMLGLHTGFITPFHCRVLLPIYLELFLDLPNAK